MTSILKITYEIHLKTQFPTMTSMHNFRLTNYDILGAKVQTGSCELKTVGLPCKEVREKLLRRTTDRQLCIERDDKVSE